MVGNKGETANLDGVKPLSTAKDTQEDVVESWIGPQQITTLDGATGDFDEGAFFWDEA
ncbi:MAG TPA: hypothetical protein VN493_06470 [Thermoanaerobaculia bacterium]|nr:hypothetical protein [Thermoanaerobaculia bacterium]